MNYVFTVSGDAMSLEALDALQRLMVDTLQRRGYPVAAVLRGSGIVSPNLGLPMSPFDPTPRPPAPLPVSVDRTPFDFSQVDQPTTPFDPEASNKWRYGWYGYDPNTMLQYCTGPLNAPNLYPTTHQCAGVRRLNNLESQPAAYLWAPTGAARGPVRSLLAGGPQFDVNALTPPPIGWAIMLRTTGRPRTGTSTDAEHVFAAWVATARAAGAPITASSAYAV